MGVSCQTIEPGYSRSVLELKFLARQAHYPAEQGLYQQKSPNSPDPVGGRCEPLGLKHEALSIFLQRHASVLTVLTTFELDGGFSGREAAALKRLSHRSSRFCQV